MKRRKRRSLGCASCGLGTVITGGKEALKAHVKACGSPFFDKDTMRFFKSRLVSVHPSYADNATYFVTSEQDPINSSRRYTARVLKGCKISTVGKFMQYGSLDAAKRAIRDRK